MSEFKNVEAALARLGIKIEAVGRGVDFIMPNGNTISCYVNSNHPDVLTIQGSASIAVLPSAANSVTIKTVGW